MSKKNKIIFIVILFFTIFVVGLCIFFVNKDLDNKDSKNNNTPTEVEVCTKDGC